LLLRVVDPYRRDSGFVRPRKFQIWFNPPKGEPCRRARNMPMIAFTDFGRFQAANLLLDLCTVPNVFAIAEGEQHQDDHDGVNETGDDDDTSVPP
jgi:hypothetical protein